MYRDYSYMQANIRYVNIWYLNTACMDLQLYVNQHKLNFEPILCWHY